MKKETSPRPPSASAHPSCATCLLLLSLPTGPPCRHRPVAHVPALSLHRGPRSVNARCPRIHTNPLTSELELFVSRQGFPSQLYNVAGETSELSLEPAIESRFDGSRRVVLSEAAKKYVDTFLRCQSLNTNQRQCSLHRTVHGLARLGFSA
jgi:hypothetical protein